MQKVKFKCALALFTADVKKSIHSKLYNVYNG